MKRTWCLGELTTHFLWCMEDLLDVYEQPYDPLHPQVCVDERPCQLIGDVLAPWPMAPGYPKREHYEYKRKGVCNAFIAFQPDTGYRFVQIRTRRTKEDYAAFMSDLAQQYADAHFIRVVQDNLNTHTPGSFYAAFPAKEAFSLAHRFDVHYTPKKASWLNMAEIELSALAKQCLDRRIGDEATLRREVCSWADQRNQERTTVDWQFTKTKAREKFRKFYPHSS